MNPRNISDEVALMWARHAPPSDAVTEYVRLGSEMAMTLNFRTTEEEREACKAVIDRVAIRLKRFGAIQAGKLWDRMVVLNGWRVTEEQSMLFLRSGDDEGNDESACQLCGHIIGPRKWIVCLPCYERVTGCGDNPEPDPGVP